MTKDPIKDLVEGRHPEYEDNLAHWNFVEETYEGGREWFDGNIFKFIKEGAVEYRQRLARSYRFNHTKQVVDQVDKYLFKMTISRKDEDAPDGIKKFWQSASLGGLDIDSFAKRISNATSIFGRVYVVVDSNVREDAFKTLKDEKDGDSKVYAYMVRPQDVLDMSYDDMGELVWVLIREYSRDDADPLNSSREVRERFRLRTRSEWILYETRVARGGKKTYVEIDRGLNSLGIVPVIHADNVFSEEQYEAPGMIDDIAYLDRAVANYLSNLDAIIQDQTFSQLAMPAQGILPGEEGADKLIEMSTKRVFLFNGESGTQPFYLSPDPKQAELILKAIGKIISEIYHSIGLSGERSKESAGVDNASGVAKSIDFERVNSLLSAKARALQLFERRLISLVNIFTAGPVIDPDDLVTYPVEFDIRSVYDEFAVATQLMLLSAPDEVRREQMRLVIDKLFPAISDATGMLLEASLKDWPPEELIAAPGLGAPTKLGDKKDPGGPAKAKAVQSAAKSMATS